MVLPEAEGVNPVAVLITGTIGVGKTAVATALGELLEAEGKAAAIIDLDWLGWYHAAPGSRVDHDSLIIANLQAVWPNFVAAGAQHLVMTRALERRESIEAFSNALPDVEVSLVRLTAAAKTIEERLRDRDKGAVLEEHLGQASRFAAGLDRLDLDAVTIATDRRPPAEVAQECLRLLGWR